MFHHFICLNRFYLADYMKRYLLAYLIFVLIYSVSILYNTDYFSPIDDGDISATSWIGKSQDEINSGRFAYLLGIEYYLLYRFLGVSDDVRIFYLINSILFFSLAGLLLCKIRNAINGVSSLILLCLLFFSQSFTSVYFVLLTTEKFIAVYFLLLYLLIDHSERISFIRLFSVFLIANLALYSKENCFVFLIIAGAGYLMSYLKTRSRYHLLIAQIFILSSLGYLLMYYIIVYHKIKMNYIDFSKPYVDVIAGGIYTWCVRQPFVMVVLLMGFYQLIRHRKNIGSVKFSNINLFSIAAYFFVASFLVLKIPFSTHYLFPIYPILIVFVYRELLPRINSRVKYALLIILLIPNAISGFNQILFQKYNNRNYHQFVSDILKLNDIYTLSMYFYNGKENVHSFLNYAYLNNRSDFTLYDIDVKDCKESLIIEAVNKRSLPPERILIKNPYNYVYFNNTCMGSKNSLLFFHADGWQISTANDKINNLLGVKNFSYFAYRYE